MAAESEQVRCELSESSVLCAGIPPLPPLLSLWSEEISGSLKSVRTLSLLVVVLRAEFSPEFLFSTPLSRQSMSWSLDQRRLLHSKVHLSLMAKRSSSSESSLCKSTREWINMSYFVLPYLFLSNSAQHLNTIPVLQENLSFTLSFFFLFPSPQSRTPRGNGLDSLKWLFHVFKGHIPSSVKWLHNQCDITQNISFYSISLVVQ